MMEQIADTIDQTAPPDRPLVRSNAQTSIISLSSLTPQEVGTINSQLQVPRPLKSSSASESSVVKKWICDICEKSYTLKKNLKQHFAESHVKSNKFSCRNCEVTFARKRSLTHHIDKEICVVKKDTSGNDIKFKCSVCEMEFGSKFVVDLHTRQNHPANFYQYTCTQCDRKYRSKIKLNHHIRDIHNHVKATCSVCGFTCRQIDLNSHIQHKHSKSAIEKQDDKVAAMSKAEINRERYRKLRSEPGDLMIKSTVKYSDKYYLHVNKLQRLRIKMQSILKPDIKEPAINQHHIKGWGYVSEGTDCPITYEKLNEEDKRNLLQVFGYVWRDGNTFEILEVYFGMCAEGAEDGARQKWNKVLKYSEKGCSDSE